MANWLKKSLETAAAFLTDLLDTPDNYTGKKGKVLAVNDTETGVELVDQATGGAGILDVTQLEGYGTTVIVTDANTGSNVTSALCPCRGGGSLYVRVDEYSGWFRNTQTIGLFTAGGSGTRTGKPNFRTGSPAINWDAPFADVPTGFYWFCAPGSGAVATFKFWYDKDKWEAVLAGTSTYIYFDEAGCAWAGDPEAGGKFICGPTMEDAFGTVVPNIHYDDTQNVTALCPMANSSGQCRIILGSESSVWENATGGVGLDKTFSGGGDHGTRHDESGLLFEITSGTWDVFADVSTGMYEIVLPYTDGTNNIEGNTVQFWYDRDKYIKAFRGTSGSVYAHIDEFGGIWKGGYSSGDEFVCGPYEGTPYTEYKTLKENEGKLQVSSNDQTYKNLLDKLQEGDGITLTEVNDGGDEKIEISSDGGGGAAGADGTILTGETEATVVIEDAVYNRATVSAVGTNATQRTPQIKSISDDGTDTTVVVHMSDTYTEDIDFHIVLANE